MLKKWSNSWQKFYARKKNSLSWQFFKIVFGLNLFVSIVFLLINLYLLLPDTVYAMALTPRLAVGLFTFQTMIACLILVWSVERYLSQPLKTLITDNALSLNELGTKNADAPMLMHSEVTTLDNLFLHFKNQIYANNINLEHTENRLTGIINAMPSVLIGVDQHCLILDWNNQAASHTGLQQKDVLHKTLREVYPPFSIYQDMVQLALESKTAQKKTRVLEVINAENKFFDVLVFPVHGSNFLGAVIRIDDISNRIKLEEIMAQTEKMSSMGGLAAGVAHEINNPLGAILQGAQNILRRIDPSMASNVTAANELGLDMVKLNLYLERRKIIEFIQGIRDSGERASKIVTNLLQFSRRTNNNKIMANFKDILEKSIELARADYDLMKQTDFKHIELIRNYEENLPNVFCCNMEIEQVILNLLKNAAQAMKSLQQAKKIWLSLRAVNDQIECIIEDNGPGMSEEIRKRIFEPFFTTKPIGEGTGLGLSVSYGIVVENHKGSLNVESVPGKGTKFIIGLSSAQAVAYVAANDVQRDAST